MKKDLLITTSSFSFFIQHLGKPHQLFYVMSLYDCDDSGVSPGTRRAGAAVKCR
jgi:hypothetical protein